MNAAALLRRTVFIFAALLGSAGATGFAAGAETSTSVETDLAFLGAGRTEKLDLYRPVPPPEGRRSPALVWIHGGGWNGGTKSEARAKNICTTAAEAGYVAVSIDYRLGAGAWPTNLHDCKNAVRYLRANAERLRLDPERIAVAGGSAGGHLALMVALTAGDAAFEPAGDATPYPGRSSAVRCAVNFYGITNLLTRLQTDAKGEPTATRKLMAGSLAVFGAADESAAVLRAASPVTHVSARSVPLFTLHGKADTTVDYLQAQELDRVARERGARHRLLLLDEVGHTFDLQKRGKKTLSRDLRPVFLGFLAEQMK